MKLNHKNDIDYGSAANGVQVGSGWDVEIRRESKTVALVNVIRPNRSTDCLGAFDVEPDTDLQEMAREIGNCPGLAMEGCVDSDSPDWDGLAARWNALEVR